LRGSTHARVVYAGETPYRTAGRLRSYAANVPDIGAPDERQHANYVQHLLDGNGFPVFKPNVADSGEHYEDHQPPLFYLAEAGFANWSVFPTSTRQTLTSSDGLTPSSALERFWVFSISGFGDLAGQKSSWAAAITAMLPMNCALSGAISNDPLLFMICTWTLAVCANALRQGWNLRLAIAAGTLVGLGILTKTTAVALLPILLLAVALPQKQRPTWGMFAVAAVILAILAVPWLVRNQQEYGDPLALKVFNSAFGGSRQKADAVAQVQIENPDGGNAS